MLLNELLNICIYCILDIFFPVRVLKVLLRIYYKVGKEEIKILSDVFVPLSLCIEKLILATVSKYFSTCCWTTVLHLYYLCLCIIHYAKLRKTFSITSYQEVCSCLWLTFFFYEIKIILSVSVLTKLVLIGIKRTIFAWTWSRK